MIYCHDIFQLSHTGTTFFGGSHTGTTSAFSLRCHFLFFPPPGGSHMFFLFSLSLFIIFLSLLVMVMLTTGIAPTAQTLVVTGASSARPQLGFLQSGALGGGLFAQYSKNFILKGEQVFAHKDQQRKQLKIVILLIYPYF